MRSSSSPFATSVTCTTGLCKNRYPGNPQHVSDGCPKTRIKGTGKSAEKPRAGARNNLL
jgi:hypothetical protein